MPGRNYTSSNYRYGFNGKENDNEVKGAGNQQDYGMRIYDPRIGKFLSVDPLQHDYPELTTYQFASNSPIWGIDLDGLEILKFQLIKKDNKPQLKTAGVDIGFTNGFGAFVGHDLSYNLESNGQHYSFTNVDDMKTFVESDQSKSKSDEQLVGEIFEAGMNALVQMHGEAQNDAANSALSKSSVSDYDAPLVISNKQNSSANNGVKSNGTKSSGPTEPYNRKKFYGKTPTAGDRKALGAGKGVVVDHTTPLVKHYYEGDGFSTKPGYAMTQAERTAFAKDRSKMQLQSDKASQKQGAEMSKYSKEKKKEFNLNKK